MQLLQDAPAPARPLGRSLVGSAIAHGILLALIALVMGARYVETRVERPAPLDVVYLDQPGPGGGGGGNPAPAPARQLEIPKPVAPPQPIVALTPVPDVPPPPPTLDVSVMTNAANVLQAAGNSRVSLGSYGGGGTGNGIGTGDGPGAGPGKGGNFGDGLVRPGSGCANPAPIKSPDPVYTSEAMRAKIQGEVLLEVVVEANGTVGAVRVIKSLDTTYGLDQEAIRTAKRWLFRPATCQGKPSAMVVQLGVEFHVR